MRVLGVDPGLRFTGYGIIQTNEPKDGGFFMKRKNKQLALLEAGIIRTNYDLNLADRLKKIYEGVYQLIIDYRPQILVLEELYVHYKHPKTAILMAHARGVICLSAAISGIKLVGLPAKRIKKAIVGTGNATKAQVQKVIKEMLNVKKESYPSDISDAIALALTYIYTPKISL